MRLLFVALALGIGAGIYSCGNAGSANDPNGTGDSTGLTKKDADKNNRPALDTAAYNKQMQYISKGDTTGRWPVKGPYPVAGAVLPFNRVVAYYGNLFSTKMGALGEFPKPLMLKKLMEEVRQWEKADSSIPVIPALHYIAVTAQGAPGKDGKYRARMPFHQIDTIYNWAKEIKALTFVDIQVGHSTVQSEVPEFDEYLKRPDFHFGIDPEFSMKGGERPGSVIGSFNADDINWVINHLAKIVKDNNLPPKMLVLHRFTNNMIMNYQNIKLVPEVQVIVDMDGWGDKALKAGTWKHFIYNQPVQFAGFKLFYKNDLKRGGSMYTPQELVKFTPQPMYIQYQ